MGPFTPVPATAKTFPVAARNVNEKPDLALLIDGRTVHVPFDIEYSSAPLKNVFRFLPPATKMLPFAQPRDSKRIASGIHVVGWNSRCRYYCCKSRWR
jgi:hypothetical protein